MQKSYQQFINNFIDNKIGDFRQPHPQPNHTPPLWEMCRRRVTLLQIFSENFFSDSLLVPPKFFFFILFWSITFLIYVAYWIFFSFLILGGVLIPFWGKKLKIMRFALK